MKPIPPISRYATFAFLLLTSCLGTDYESKTQVQPDGSLVRSLSISRTDSARAERNMFGINSQNGWQKSVTIHPDTAVKDKVVMFTKTFADAEAANAESAQIPDTLIRITSDYRESLKWFYTSVRYSDTYVRIIQSEKVQLADYISDEDFEFIHQLQKQPKRSGADSTRFQKIDERFTDYWASILFEDLYGQVLGLMQGQGLESRWTDTLANRKNRFKESVLRSEFNSGSVRSILIDTLHIPLDRKHEFKLTLRNANYPLFDTFVHTIEMPSKIVSTNADSVSGSWALWRLTKEFTVRDFEMVAETRRLNYWAIVVTVVIVSFVVRMIVKKSRGS